MSNESGREWSLPLESILYLKTFEGLELAGRRMSIDPLRSQSTSLPVSLTIRTFLRANRS